MLTLYIISRVYEAYVYTFLPFPHEERGQPVIIASSCCYLGIRNKRASQQERQVNTALCTCKHEIQEQRANELRATYCKWFQSLEIRTCTVKTVHRATKYPRVWTQLKIEIQLTEDHFKRGKRQRTHDRNSLSFRDQKEILQQWRTLKIFSGVLIY